VSKIIVITGAGSGLGRALARRLAADGETVVLLGRSLDKVQAVADEVGGSAFAVACDVGDPDSVRAAFATIAERHPRIDVLVNNAAIYQPFLITEATDRQVLGSVLTNLAGPIFCVRSAVPLMGEGGHIINVSSESVGMIFPYLTMYQASKAGLERFGEALVHELEPAGIRVTTLRAGQMFAEGMSLDVDRETGMRFYQACVAAGLDLAKRPISPVETVTGVFRALIDLPADVHLTDVRVQARKAGA
jgi:3-oxoacyl-[acyl-carrier protein] reductase